MIKLVIALNQRAVKITNLAASHQVGLVSLLWCDHVENNTIKLGHEIILKVKMSLLVRLCTSHLFYKVHTPFRTLTYGGNDHVIDAIFAVARFGHDGFFASKSGTLPVFSSVNRSTVPPQVTATAVRTLPDQSQQEPLSWILSVQGEQHFGLNVPIASPAGGST